MSGRTSETRAASAVDGSKPPDGGPSRYFIAYNFPRVVITIDCCRRTSRHVEAQMKFTSIELKDLKNTGTFLDKQDPCVHLQVGGASFQYPRQVDAGTAATFTDEILLDVSDEELTGMVSYLIRFW